MTWISVSWPAACWEVYEIEMKMLSTVIVLNVLEQVWGIVWFVRCKHFSPIDGKVWGLLVGQAKKIWKLKKKKKKNPFKNVGMKDFSQCSEYSFWLSGLAAVIISSGAFGKQLFIFLCSEVLNACVYIIRRNVCCVVEDSCVICAPVNTLAQWWPDREVNQISCLGELNYFSVKSTSNSGPVVKHHLIPSPCKIL